MKPRAWMAQRGKREFPVLGPFSTSAEAWAAVSGRDGQALIGSRVYPAGGGYSVGPKGDLVMTEEAKETEANFDALVQHEPATNEEAKQEEAPPACPEIDESVNSQAEASAPEETPVGHGYGIVKVEKTFRRYLSVKLTAEEKAAHAEHMSELLRSQEETEIAKDAAAKSWKTKLSGIESELREVGAAVRTGTIEREVFCSMIRNDQLGTMNVFRCDTGELVEQRAQTYDERQTTLFSGAPETPPSAAVEPERTDDVVGPAHVRRGKGKGHKPKKGSDWEAATQEANAPTEPAPPPPPSADGIKFNESWMAAEEQSA